MEFRSKFGNVNEAKETFLAHSISTADFSGVRSSIGKGIFYFQVGPDFIDRSSCGAHSCDTAAKKTDACFLIRRLAFFWHCWVHCGRPYKAWKITDKTSSNMDARKKERTWYEPSI
jgi:hypothetical protein